MIGLLAELPDLWDFALGGWDNDSQTSRFSEEGNQEPYIAGLKAADHASPWWASAASPRPTPWCARSARGCSI